MKEQINSTYREPTPYSQSYSNSLTAPTSQQSIRMHLESTMESADSNMDSQETAGCFSNCMYFINYIPSKIFGAFASFGNWIMSFFCQTAQVQTDETDTDETQEDDNIPLSTSTNAATSNSNIATQVNVQNNMQASASTQQEQSLNQEHNPTYQELCSYTPQELFETILNEYNGLTTDADKKTYREGFFSSIAEMGPFYPGISPDKMTDEEFIQLAQELSAYLLFKAQFTEFTESRFPMTLPKTRETFAEEMIRAFNQLPTLLQEKGREAIFEADRKRNVSLIFSRSEGLDLPDANARIETDIRKYPNVNFHCIKEGLTEWLASEECRAQFVNPSRLAQTNL